MEASHPAANPTTDVKGTTSVIQHLGVEHKTNSAPAGNATTIKDHASAPAESDLRRTVCKGGPCQEPAPKPVQLKPVIADAPREVCKDGSCQPCPVGQLAGKNKNKDGPCGTAPSAVKKGSAAVGGSARNGVPQPCPAGQVWNGAQCLPVGAQQCLPNQIMVGTSCQTDCAMSTTSAQSIIMELRSARLHKDDICRQNPTGMECQQAEAHYNLEFVEYQTFLAGVPTECRTALPDPIAI